MGFGTGLNTLLSIINQPKNVNVSYLSAEAFPVEMEILKQLNYGTLAFDKELYSTIIECPFGVWKNLTKGFLLKKQKANFLTETFPSHFFDIIYYDAFGPKIQPELWTREAMEKCFEMLVKGGILITYCAQGQFKRNLKAAGFIIEELPGPPGKAQITRAIKI